MRDPTLRYFGMAAMSSQGVSSDDYGRSIIDVFKSEVINKLRVTDIAPHLHEYVPQNTLRSDGQAPVEQCEEFLEKLVACRKPGWYNAFILQLKSENKYLAKLLGLEEVGTQTLTFMENLLYLFWKHLQIVDDVQIIVHQLRVLGHVSRGDEQRVVSKETQVSSVQGMVELLQIVTSKDDNLPVHFVEALYECKHESIIGAFDPDLLEAVKEGKTKQFIEDWAEKNHHIASDRFKLRKMDEFDKQCETSEHVVLVEGKPDPALLSASNIHTNEASLGHLRKEVAKYDVCMADPDSDDDEFHDADDGTNLNNMSDKDKTYEKRLECELNIEVESSIVTNGRQPINDVAVLDDVKEEAVFGRQSEELPSLDGHHADNTMRPAMTSPQYSMIDRLGEPLRYHESHKVTHPLQDDDWSRRSSSQQSAQKTEKPSNEFWWNGKAGECNICKISLTSENHAKQHLAGKKHRQKRGLFSIEQSMATCGISEGNHKLDLRISGEEDCTSLPISGPVNRQNSEVTSITSIDPCSIDRTLWHTCQTCGKRVNSKEQLRVHIESHGPDMEDPNLQQAILESLKTTSSHPTEGSPSTEARLNLSQFEERTTPNDVVDQMQERFALPGKLDFTAVQGFDSISCGRPSLGQNGSFGRGSVNLTTRDVSSVRSTSPLSSSNNLDFISSGDCRHPTCMYHCSLCDKHLSGPRPLEDHITSNDHTKKARRSGVY